MTTSTQTSEKKKKPFYKRIWFIILVGIIILIALVQAINSGEESTDTASSESATAAPESEATPVGDADATAAAPATPAADSGQVMPWTRHEACQADDGTAGMISGVLNDSTLQVQNAQLIKDGADTWIGASLVRPDGEFESRSGVWLLRDGALYAVSGGARNASWAVEAPGVSMADEYPAGVDRCVVAETMGR